MRYINSSFTYFYLLTLALPLIVLSGPSSEDLESFVSYLIQLIHGCDLEHVALLLRYIQRSVLFCVMLPCLQCYFSIFIPTQQYLWLWQLAVV